MSSINRDRLRALIAERQTTARAISRAISTNETLVRDILSGKSKNARGDSVAKIAEHLGVSVDELMTGPDVAPSHVGPALAELPIRGEVQAGMWLAIDYEPEERTYPAAADPRFPAAIQWLSVVKGDSMNALVRSDGTPAGIYEGDMVHCIDAIAARYTPRTGDIVEVERIRFSDRDRELTIKQVEVTPDGILLWPRSTNPQHKAPLPYAEGDQDSTEVRIRGWVIGINRRF